MTPLTDADLPALFEWINDRALVQLSSAYKPVTADEHRAWFAAIQGRNDTVIFAIRVAGRLIGSCQLHGIDWVHRHAELQIRIGDRAAWGKGYGTDATCGLVDYGFRTLNLHRIYLRVFATNAAALRTYEKAGFVREATLRDGACLDGVFVDVVQMAVVRH